MKQNLINNYLNFITKYVSFSNNDKQFFKENVLNGGSLDYFIKILDNIDALTIEDYMTKSELENALRVLQSDDENRALEEREIGIMTDDLEL